MSGKQRQIPSSENEDRKAIVGASVAGFIAWVIVFASTADGVTEPHPLWIALGRAGLTLTTVAVIGGLVREAFKRREMALQKIEEEHQFYRNLLADVKSVYDSVERARLLVGAHKSAKSYGEQLRAIIDARVILHNLTRALIPEFEAHLASELRPHLDACQKFIDRLISEYRNEYLEISRKQSLDEAINKVRRERIVKDGRPPGAFRPSQQAWEAISKLREMGPLCTGRDEGILKYRMDFEAHIDAISMIVRSRLPVSETLRTPWEALENARRIAPYQGADE